MREIDNQLLMALLNQHFDKSLNQLPKELKTLVEECFEEAHWDAHSPNQRRQRVAQEGDEHNSARKVERAAAWLDYTMDARAWWLAESISPLNAAMLLSRLNPNTEKVEDAETNSSDEMGPQDFRRLRNIFEGASKDVTRTLKDWTEYSRQRGLKIHSWIGEWEAWVSEVDAQQAPPETQAPVMAASASGGTDQTPDPERRLARLRALGGTHKYARGEWKFTGIVALVESEKAEGRKRSDEKTIRADLKDAAQTERDAKSAGFGAGLGQR